MLSSVQKKPGPPYTTDVHLIENTGKMVILDKMLRSAGSNPQMSFMSRVLDILEDYCVFRGYNVGTSHEDCIAAIDDYNKPGIEKHIFLLTTRADGLGIHLTAADIVVL